MLMTYKLYLHGYTVTVYGIRVRYKYIRFLPLYSYTVPLYSYTDTVIPSVIIPIPIPSQVISYTVIVIYW